jgi:endogenous inhibitor of DNA gyrase (YacG/DUF329 family)
MPTVVNCPNCGRPVEWTPASRYRPFCSERCRLIDLGEWLAENHRIPDSADAPRDDLEDSEGEPQTH